MTTQEFCIEKKNCQLLRDEKIWCKILQFFSSKNINIRNHLNKLITIYRPYLNLNEPYNIICNIYATWKHKHWLLDNAKELLLTF